MAVRIFHAFDVDGWFAANYKMMDDDNKSGASVIQQERGFGLIEVLVALLLVSVVFFGFLAVQMRAYHTSQDAVIRTHATSLLSTQAQILQGHDESVKQSYQRLFNQLNRSGSSGQMMDYYQKSLAAIRLSCHQQACTPADAVNYQAIQSAKVAATHGVRMNVVSCPAGRCLLAVWGETKAEQGEGSCINQVGAIHVGARCVMMVVY